MKKDNTYYIFADDLCKDEYGLPKLHFRNSFINLHADWFTLLSFLSQKPELKQMKPIYKVPEQLKNARGLRDLTATEIQNWEAGLLERKLIK
ncbi:MAG: hypothetical protein QW404_02110 [Candidatus Nanoarchaeia archaeon]